MRCNAGKLELVTKFLVLVVKPTHHTPTCFSCISIFLLQERQDAVTDLVERQQVDGVKPLDFVLVVGGFDSSNTAHLKEIPENFGRYK